jgi:hypothetical protein
VSWIANLQWQDENVVMYFSVFIAHGNKQTLDVHRVDISGLGRKRMCMHTGYLLQVQWRRRFTTGRLVLCIASFS